MGMLRCNGIVSDIRFGFGQRLHVEVCVNALFPSFLLPFPYSWEIVSLDNTLYSLCLTSLLLAFMWFDDPATFLLWMANKKMFHCKGCTDSFCKCIARATAIVVELLLHTIRKKLLEHYWGGFRHNHKVYPALRWLCIFAGKRRINSIWWPDKWLYINRQDSRKHSLEWRRSTLCGNDLWNPFLSSNSFMLNSSKNMGSIMPFNWSIE